MVLGACASAPPPGRSASSLGATVADDAAIRAAERALAEGSLARAAELWEALARDHAGDALGHYAALRLARLDLATPGADGVTRARDRVASLPAALDATLALRRSLVSALATARDGRPDPALARMMASLRGRFVDAQDVVEANCALAALSPSGADALEALARVEGAVERGVRWVSTGLACDGSESRTALFGDVLARVEAPAEVAAVLDALPAVHPWRTPLARRLRAVAEARGEVRAWMSHLADLPDDEAAIRPTTPGASAPTLRIGILAPLSGAVANVGAEAVRAAQQALEGVSQVELIVEDESQAVARRAAVGSPPLTSVDALVRSLRERGASAIVGPSMDANVAAAVAAAREQGVALWLPTPAEEAPTAVGPTLAARAEALAAAAGRRSRRVVLHLPTLPPDPALDGALRAALGRHGVTVARAGDASAGHLLAGFFDEEAQRRWGAAAARGGEWVIDARSLPPDATSRWVGAGASAAYGAFLGLSCERSDRAPTENAVLYYDAVLAAVGAAGNGQRLRALEGSAGVLTADAVRGRTCRAATESGR